MLLWSLRWAIAPLVLLPLLLVGGRAAAIPPLESLAGGWQKGDRWVVEYRYQQPSAAATADPTPTKRTRSWRCEVLSTNPRLLQVTSDDDEQQIELEFDVAPPHALISGVVYGRNFARARVRLDQFENPNPGRSYFTELKAGPFIASHPALGPDGGPARQAMQLLPDGRYEIALSGARQTVRFVWSPGAKWWSEAWSGAVTATARLDPFPARGGAVRALQPLTRAEVQRGTSALAPAAKDCGRRTGVGGLVQLKLTIAADGTVSAAQVIGRQAGSEVARCVEEAARGATFPQSSGPLGVSVPLRLD